MSELSLDLLFSNPADKDSMLSAFAKVGEDINDPYAHLTAQEKEVMNATLQLIGQKNRLAAEDYQPIVQIVEPELPPVNHLSTQVEVLKKFGVNQVGSMLNVSDLNNLAFLLKFNIVKLV